MSIFKEQWLIYAALSAVFAALTSIFAKIGISGIDSNLATAIRTCVVLALAWAIAGAALIAAGTLVLAL